MLLTITNLTAPATDLGYLLHKHPDKVQEVPLSFGKAHVFYPEATGERCTAALLLEVDTVALARGHHDGGDAPLEPYVNDRPYVASSLLSVALSRVFGTALHGRCEKRPELATQALSLVARLSVLPCRGGEALLRQLFEPLGYQVEGTRHALDPRFPDWGASSYFTVELRTLRPLSELLTQLYVLVPVLDDDKHYFVGDDEVTKLLAKGEGWLAAHPQRELIAARYLKHQGYLSRRALAQLVQLEDQGADPDCEAALQAREEESVEEKVSLAEHRVGAVIAAFKDAGASSVLDLGCGEGRLLRALLKEKSFGRIVGLDVSHQALKRAAERLHLTEAASNAQSPGARRHRGRLTLLHGSLTYRDSRLEGFDAAAVVEVVEHLEPDRLRAFERVLFEHARPRTIVLTTPNVEYNVRFADLPAGRLRHRDHRFEWTRSEFQSWSTTMATRFGYAVRFLPVGPVDPHVGSPTQMGIFRHD
jgi:3' terminal RNA ribose 2'-O-methyltransferase Hen1